MRKSILATLLASVATLGISAETIDVKAFRYAGPFAVPAPVEIDSVDVNFKKFDPTKLLSAPVGYANTATWADFSGSTLPKADVPTIHLLSFTIDNERFAKAKLAVNGMKHKQVIVDGKPVEDEELILKPATHKVVVKCLSLPGNESDSVYIALETATPQYLTVGNAEKRRYTLQDVQTGKRITGISLSPSGKYVMTAYTTTHEDGTTSQRTVVEDAANGRQLLSQTRRLYWMPKSDLLYYTVREADNAKLITLDPVSGAEKVVCENLPDGWFMISPTEDFLIATVRKDGPKEKQADLYEIVNPEDRQAGWRDRGELVKTDFATGLTVPLTFGYQNIALCDISDDGSKILFQAVKSRLEKRPTTITTFYVMNLEDRTVEKLAEDGFVGQAILSPDGKSVAYSASPEAFDGIGKNVPEGMTPSMYDYQIFTQDIASKQIKPLTRDFNPSIEEIQWSRFDNKIYFLVNDRDLRSLFRVDPATGRIDDLGAKEEYVMNFAMASAVPQIAYYGQGANNSDRSYMLNAKNMRHSLKEDLSSERLADINLGKCHTWNFKSSRGDSICARYVVPADFDPAKKYPLIVNYYGGCNPTSRTFEGRYPHHLYAANGYVVLLIVPSGATGFGQEQSARHVNTAGEGIAEEIIDGVKQFVAEMPWVNAEKIGCIGASYGGFMTQYLQTKTDLFAAAISHAGISDHTSYWGEGYWGYSYSEVSMANSYPWSHQDLYVKQSPLYNADKIHTPLLFLHGDGDTNVPFGESIQMYTALKLLGRETAFVAVRGANHQVTDFTKRKQWQDTIFAWFAKYLQDDPSWWEEMYPAKSL